MNWIIADLIMFVCSVALYIAIRKAALNKMPTQFNNLAMFAVPAVAFVAASLITQPYLALSTHQALLILFAALVLSYLGNVMSMKSIELAPNPGYSLVLSKSYVVMTSVLAVPLFGARLTTPALVAIFLIVGCSALIMINPRASHNAKSPAWVPLAMGSFLCWGFLSLVAKHLMSQGLPTLVFLTYLFVIVTIIIAAEMLYKRISFEVVTKNIRPFLCIGITGLGFNFFNFYTISIAPNVGYVNATNAASIGAVTVLSAILFKDELTKKKLAGVVGVITGLLMLFIWK